MNDFYWLNINNTSIFYIIPEKVLFEQNKIEDNKKLIIQKQIFNININKDDMWYSKFKYNYDNLDINLIYNIFY